MHVCTSDFDQCFCILYMLLQKFKMKISWKTEYSRQKNNASKILSYLNKIIEKLSKLLFIISMTYQIFITKTLKLSKYYWKIL